MLVLSKVLISRLEALSSNFYIKTVLRSTSGQCPIHIAASNNTTSRSALDFFLGAGMDTETNYGDRRSLLSNAMVCRSEFYPIVKLLLAKRAEIDTVNL